MLGMPTTGKGELIYRYCNKKFSGEVRFNMEKETHNISYNIINETENGKAINIEIWDLPGRCTFNVSKIPHV